MPPKSSPKPVARDSRVTQQQLDEWLSPGSLCEAALRLLLKPKSALNAATSRGLPIEDPPALVSFLLCRCHDLSIYKAARDTMADPTWRLVLLSTTYRRGNLLGMALYRGNRFPVARFLLDGDYVQEQLVGACKGPCNPLSSLAMAGNQALPHKRGANPSTIGTYEEQAIVLLQRIAELKLIPVLSDTLGPSTVRDAVIYSLSMSPKMWRILRDLVPDIQLCDQHFMFLTQAARYYTDRFDPYPLELVLTEMETRTDLPFAPIVDGNSPPLFGSGSFFPRSRDWISVERRAHHAHLYVRLLRLFQPNQIARIIYLYQRHSTFGAYNHLAIHYKLQPFMLLMAGPFLFEDGGDDIPLWKNIARTHLSRHVFDLLVTHQGDLSPEDLAVFSGGLFHWRSDALHLSDFSDRVCRLSEEEQTTYRALCDMEDLTAVTWAKCEEEMTSSQEWLTFAPSLPALSDELKLGMFSSAYDACRCLETLGVANTEQLIDSAQKVGLDTMLDLMQAKQAKKSARSNF